MKDKPTCSILMPNGDLVFFDLHDPRTIGQIVREHMQGVIDKLIDEAAEHNKKPRSQM
jgi:hypothetical protein